jgi:hypothetical protein
MNGLEKTLFTVGLAAAAAAAVVVVVAARAVQFLPALPYERAIAEVTERSKNNCLPGQRVSSPPIPIL